MAYDYLIVGAGLFGSVFAFEAQKRGKKCIVIDRRSHTGGNLYCESIENINVHKYGAHIFHTSNEEVWRYVNQFASFNSFINSPIAIYKGEVYNLPFNMNTFNRMWGVKTPSEARLTISRQIGEQNIVEPGNLEEKALAMVGRDIYEKLVKGYTEKQWGRPCNELPAFIINRLPVRFNYDNNYFSDRYQGIPIGGYNQIFKKLLKGIEVKLGTDYKEFISDTPDIADKIVYTGMIDEFYKYKFGALEYRSLKFENEIIACDNYQGNAVVNYTDRDVPFTRIIEHKHFEFGTQPATVITKEYPLRWKPEEEPYYPVNTEENTAVYNKYKDLAEHNSRVLFGGRLGLYKYYDMDKIIELALDTITAEFGDK